MDDLISRQAAIDAVGYYSCYSGDELLFADKPLKALPSVENKGEWISISERLPNHDECIKNNRFFNVSDGDRSYSEWFDYDKQMFGAPTMSGFRVDRAVTAWQPLPEPYKAER